MGCKSKTITQYGQVGSQKSTAGFLRSESMKIGKKNDVEVK